MYLVGTVGTYTFLAALRSLRFRETFRAGPGDLPLQSAWHLDLYKYVQ